MERDYEYTLKCHLDDIKRAEVLGKVAAENTIRLLPPLNTSKEEINMAFELLNQVIIEIKKK